MPQRKVGGKQVNKAGKSSISKQKSKRNEENVKLEQLEKLVQDFVGAGVVSTSLYLLTCVRPCEGY
jgi:hypothetical protein